ncbi:MAG: cold shock domain-containing protein, partial [Candidatus Latescibacteria bacterium]|nr:cold shock domain-containing protein [Candidatus Latescibacterota bacterium]
MAISGTVKWFNDRLGYGFLQRDDGDDVFFHYTVLESVESIEEGEDEEFEIADGP